MGEDVVDLRKHNGTVLIHGVDEDSFILRYFYMSYDCVLAEFDNLSKSFTLGCRIEER